jgi:hypothetical protein
MSNGTTGNKRDGSESWTEGLFTGAGASLGRVLDTRQRHAVDLTLEVFAYLLATLPDEDVQVADVIRLVKWYVKGVDGA